MSGAARHAARGTTTVYGVVREVTGGPRPDALLALHGGALLRVTLGPGLEAPLRSRMLRAVGLEGEAAWDPQTWDVLGFHAAALLPYEECSAEEAFAELRRAAAGAWDGVDAAEFVRRLRADD